jgi:ribonuclease P protein component
VIYLLQEGSLPVAPQMGLIINKSVGGSVTRHRIARQLRHAVATHLSLIPEHTQIVIRVLKESGDYRGELQELLPKVLKRVNSQNITSQKIDVTA